MVIHVVRALFLVVFLAITIFFAVQKEQVQKGSQYVTAYILIPAIVAVAVIFIDMFWRRKRLQVLSGLFFGLLGGLAIAYMMSLIVSMVVALFPAPPRLEHPGAHPQKPMLAEDATAAERAEYDQLLKQHRASKDKYDSDMAEFNKSMSFYKNVQLVKLLLGAAVVFLCVSFVLQTKDDFRFVIPYVEFSRETKGARPMLLDTSVIIDGRIADIAETGVLESELLVPRFILSELQAIADSEDRLKRNRGRRGLDVLNRLQGNKKIDIRIIDPHVPAVEAAPDVDGKLLALAKHLSGRAVTNDYNLNKVAKLRGVDIININDLANAMKPVALPGERLSVQVVKPGEEAGQGVGYLPDGTMVVAEQGRDYIGKEIVITVTSALQTSAGRMIFGRLDPDRTFGPKARKA
ncbi:MAG TPA: PIN domain-containing protein [Phycisphaerae bacterium]|nr:PIN domain-containing protein [Phycisphaerae bacterium]HUT58461.1 PIN domain-containing protein [Phycisphaerae bacterium]